MAITVPYFLIAMGCILFLMYMLQRVYKRCAIFFVLLSPSHPSLCCFADCMTNFLQCGCGPATVVCNDKVSCRVSLLGDSRGMCSWTFPPPLPLCLLYTTPQGLPTIRAFGVSDRLSRENVDKLDTNIKSFFLLRAVFRWAALRMELLNSFAAFVGACGPVV